MSPTKYPILPVVVIMVLTTYSTLFLLLFAFKDRISGSTILDVTHQTAKPIFFQINLDSDGKVKMFWTLDYKTQVATIEVAATLSTKTDWLAVGFSNDGNVTRADLCILWTDRENKVHFDDIWSDDDGFVNVDDQNDCQYLKVTRKLDTIRLVYQRKFETCDDKDYVIEDGTTHVVYAIGQGPIKRLTSIRLLRSNHGFVRTRFLKVMTQAEPPSTTSKQIVVVNNGTKVPSVETTYWCSIHQLPAEVAATKHHVTSYEAVIQVGNEPLVHHMEVFHCEVGPEIQLPNYDGPCHDKPKTIEICKRVIAAWAMGAEALIYPIEAGLPIGGSNYSRYVMLEMHYNNPHKKSDWIDSSGLRLVYTNQLRKFDVGVLEVGLEYTDKNSIPPEQDAFQLLGYCVSECTRIGLTNPKGIYAFASQLHTHLTGVKVFTKHIRGGVELPELNRDNHYSQHFQEIRILRDLVNIQPGDALINYCEYDTRGRENVTLGGFAISEEMCVNYIHYYPKSDLEVCKSSIDGRMLKRYFKYMHDFEGDETDPDGKGIADNYKSIHWSHNKAKQLKAMYDNGPLSMQCNMSSGDRFPGNWEGTPVTRIWTEFPKKESVCRKLL